MHRQKKKKCNLKRNFFYIKCINIQRLNCGYNTIAVPVCTIDRRITMQLSFCGILRIDTQLHY